MLFGLDDCFPAVGLVEALKVPPSLTTFIKVKVYYTSLSSIRLVAGRDSWRDRKEKIPLDCCQGNLLCYRRFVLNCSDENIAHTHTTAVGSWSWQLDQSASEHTRLWFSNRLRTKNAWWESVHFHTFSYLLFITYYLLSIIYYLLSIIYY